MVIHTSVRSVVFIKSVCILVTLNGKNKSADTGKHVR
jgi:hypothetical protein